MFSKADFTSLCSNDVKPGFIGGRYSIDKCIEVAEQFAPDIFDRPLLQIFRPGKLTDCLLRLRRTTVSPSIARNASKNEPFGKGSMTIKYPPRPRTRIPS